MGKSAGLDAGSIVAADLGLACAAGSSTVVQLLKHNVNRSETVLEIRTYGGHENQEHIVTGGLHSHLGGRAYKQRAYIEGCTGAVRRQVVCVGADDHLAHPDEEFL